MFRLLLPPSPPCSAATAVDGQLSTINTIQELQVAALLAAGPPPIIADGGDDGDGANGTTNSSSGSSGSNGSAGPSLGQGAPAPEPERRGGGNPFLAGVAALGPPGVALPGAILNPQLPGISNGSMPTAAAVTATNQPRTGGAGQAAAAALARPGTGYVSAAQEHRAVSTAAVIAGA